MTSKEIDLLLETITVKPGMTGGKSAIRGMLFPVVDVLELLASGMSPAEIIEEHPTLEKEDISPALLFAAMRLKDVITVHAA